MIANQRRSGRRRALQQRLELEAAVQQPVLPDAADALVHEALSRLGARDREVLLLSEWEGTLARPDRRTSRLSHRDGARGRLHRARRRFRAVFEDLLSNEPRNAAAFVRHAEESET